MADISIANQDTLLDMQGIIGVKNPIISDVATTMNYLRKIEISIYNAPIIGTDGYRYRPIFEEFYNFKDMSIVQPSSGTGEEKSVNTGTGGEWFVTKGNTEATAEGVFTHNGSHVLKLDLNTLEVLATSQMDTSGSGAGTNFLRTHGDYVYSYFSLGRTLEQYRKSDLTHVNSIEYSGGMRPRLYGLGVINNYFYTIHQMKNEITVVRKVKLPEFTVEIEREVVPYSHFYGLVVNNNDCFISGSARTVNGTNIDVLDGSTLAKRYTEANLLPDTYTAGSTTTTGYIYKFNGIVGCNEKGFALHHTATYYKNSATAISTKEVVHFYFHQDWIGSPLELEIYGDLWANKNYFHRLITTANEFYYIESYLKDSVYYSRRVTISSATLNSFEIISDIITTNTVGFEYNHVINTPKFIGKTFLNQAHTGTILKEYTYPANILLNSWDTPLKPLVAYGENLYAHNNGNIYKVPKLYKINKYRRIT